MRYYFAPMEGITGYIYRNAHHKFYPGVDKYFTPFLVPNQNRRFSYREMQDIMPEHNNQIHLVPQILTNQADAFIWTALELKQLGYDEVNLNLGCPSGTVVSKRKGSGFLAFRDELDQFLDKVCSELEMKISIKTRIGKDSPKEFYELIEIFNKYHLEELIIHPRIQKDYYKNTPNLEVFGDALAISGNPVCYNGDLFTVQDYENFVEQFPDIHTIMLGRGLLMNPGLLNGIETHTVLGKVSFRQFHDTIYHGYLETISGGKNVLFKMKELWFYMGRMFTNPDKYLKKIKKSEKLTDYEIAVSNLFREQDLIEHITSISL
ncbi:MAG: hypothetical protein RHS_2428 [Robinsoniella sp. RHS]|uniref:tRNA dihydrouridine synthase n=1 Tax=Robinsoniella sp. RHS TaxID=1504536 RepID=UPI00064B1591|nr:MAG: hypothetical protein RHS_2428 [Robinsoniella sp. RHS]